MPILSTRNSAFSNILLDAFSAMKLGLFIISYHYVSNGLVVLDQ